MPSPRRRRAWGDLSVRVHDDTLQDHSARAELVRVLQHLRDAGASCCALSWSVTEASPCLPTALPSRRELDRLGGEVSPPMLIATRICLAASLLLDDEDASRCWWGPCHAAFDVVSVDLAADVTMLARIRLASSPVSIVNADGCRAAQLDRAAVAGLERPGGGPAIAVEVTADVGRWKHTGAAGLASLRVEWRSLFSGESPQGARGAFGSLPMIFTLGLDARAVAAHLSISPLHDVSHVVALLAGRCAAATIADQVDVVTRLTAHLSDRKLTPFPPQLPSPDPRGHEPRPPPTAALWSEAV